MNEATKRADRTLVVLSAAYLAASDGLAEWAVAWQRDPKGKQGRVLPVRIDRCEVKGLLGPLVFIDLVDVDEQLARERLLEGIKAGRCKPTQIPFPVSVSSQPPCVEKSESITMTRLRTLLSIGKFKGKGIHLSDSVLVGSRIETDTTT